VLLNAGLVQAETIHRDATKRRLHNYARQPHDRVKDLPPEMEEKFTFSFVRHPLTWYQSYWKHRMKHGWHPESVPIDKCASNDFTQFVRNALRYYPEGIAGCVYRYYLGPNGDAVDFVGKLERLTEDLSYALSLAEERIPEETFFSLEPQNKANQELDEQCVYTPQLRDVVLEAEQWVLQTFHYVEQLEEVGGLLGDFSNPQTTAVAFAVR
jgi:hypothetical protein